MNLLSYAKNIPENGITLLLSCQNAYHLIKPLITEVYSMKFLKAFLNPF